jgi:hypothetical protein
MSKYYYAGPDKNPLGPYSAEEMRKLADEGKISDDTFVINEGDQNWVRFADWKAAQGTAEAAENIARKAQQMKTAISKFEFGYSIFGLLLVVVEYIVLPWRLISRSGATLVNWGHSRMLPSTQSNLPVLTFYTVVLRPAIHILVTVVGALAVVAFSIYLMLDHPNQPATQLWRSITGSVSAEHGSVSTGIKFLLEGLLQVYFINILIGGIFDFISMFVLMANSLRNIERK